VKALGKLNELVAAFVKTAFERAGHGHLYNDVTSFRLRTFGSYRLDVHLPGADMDTVILVPKVVSRKDMFSILYPSMLARDDIKNVIKVEEARVPVIKFEMDGFEFDLAMAVFKSLPILPEEFDVTHDMHLKHVAGDMQSITSLNGVRVTDTIRNLVPTMETLKYCIRALKLWAKRRGVYKNVLGFLGGISIEIMAARIGQMYPKALPSKLVYFFFLVYSQWKWPQPVGLTPINMSSCDLNLPVWGMGQTESMDRRHVMPIITPVYPAQNATANVSKSTLKVMMEEFERGRDICKRIFEGNSQWKELFEENEVLNRYTNFLQVNAVAPCKVPVSEGSSETRASREYYDMWKGYCEANLRGVVPFLERYPDAYCTLVHPFQRNFSKPRTSDDAPYEHLWYLGLKFDTTKLKDEKKNPRVVEPIKAFKARIMAWKNRKEGMDLKITTVKRKQLPDFVLHPQDDDVLVEKEGSIDAQLQTAQTTELDEDANATELAPVKKEGDADEKEGDAAGSGAGAEGSDAQPVHGTPARGEGAGVKRGGEEGSDREAKRGKVKDATVEGASVDVHVKIEVATEAGRDAAAATAAAAAAAAADTAKGMAKEADNARSVTAELMAGLRKKAKPSHADPLPGVSPAKKEVFVLEAGEELRLEVDQRVVTVSLETGLAEIFGAEIPRSEPIRLVKTKLAIYSWRGATISVCGETKAVYKSEMKEMKAYANLHGYLQQRREGLRAKGAARVRGPRVMIVGPVDTGKTSLARVLLNYAVREGERPMLVDLDVSKTRHTLIAGSLGACAVTDMLSSSNALVESRATLAYHYGFRDSEHSPDLFKSLVQDLATRLEEREESGRDPLGASSGCIIDCFPYKSASKDCYSLITFAARALKAEVILVMDMDKLTADLQKDFSDDASVKVLKLAKCGGVVAHDKSFQLSLEKEVVQDYFYGTERDLCPRKKFFSFDELSIYKTAPAPVAPVDALSIGMQRPDKHTEVRKVVPDASLENRILAVAGRTPKDPSELISMNIAGFVHVQKVDVASGKIELLAPNGLPMPSLVLLQGDIEYIE
jgi:poly(A) polymerase